MATVGSASAVGKKGRILQAGSGLLDQLGIAMIRSRDGRFSVSRGCFTYGQYARLLRYFRDFPTRDSYGSGFMLQLPRRKAAQLPLARIQETLRFLEEKTGRRFYIPQGRTDLVAQLTGPLEYHFRVIEIHFEGEIPPDMVPLLESAALSFGCPTQVV